MKCELFSSRGCNEYDTQQLAMCRARQEAFKQVRAAQ